VTVVARPILRERSGQALETSASRKGRKLPEWTTSWLSHARRHWLAPGGEWTKIDSYRCEDSGVGDVGLGIAEDRVAVGCPWNWRDLDRHGHGHVRVYRVVR